MRPLFLCGPLGHRPLLAAVVGDKPTLIPARIPDRAGRRVGMPAEFALVPQSGALVEGTLLRPLSSDCVARLAFYAKVLGLASHRVTVTTATGPVQATAYALRADPNEGASWDDALWQATQAPLATEIAVEVMAAFGQTPATRLRARLGPLMVRAASRLRAVAQPPAHDLRRPPAPLDIRARRQPYAHFFAVEEYDLSFPRFDGAPSPVITRATFVSADAVTVLPYDPARDRVLLIEQMRAGPFGRGDPNPWQLEAIAGRIDAGESAEDCARREAVEEAGLTFGKLLPVANYYPSPGAKTEFIYSYIALADLPDGSAGLFGVAEEAEDIRGHLIAFDDAMALVATGEIQNAPLLLTLMWLQRERPRLQS